MTHIKRDPIEQNLHDSVIDDVVSYINKNKKSYDNIRINKGHSNSYSVKRGNEESYYPDVFLVKNKIVIEIYEVETNQTINQDSVSQWKQYSSGQAKFYLVVPKDKLEEVKILVKENNIEVDNYLTF